MAERHMKRKKYLRAFPVSTPAATHIYRSIVYCGVVLSTFSSQSKEPQFESLPGAELSKLTFHIVFLNPAM
jgi:hypothetical protein